MNLKIWAIIRVLCSLSHRTLGNPVLPLPNCYGLLGAWLIHRFDLAVAVMIGAGLGLAIYLVNFYIVAPMAFPWFEMARNWIGVFAHIMFGAVIAYRIG